VSLFLMRGNRQNSEGQPQLLISGRAPRICGVAYKDTATATSVARVGPYLRAYSIVLINIKSRISCNECRQPGFPYIR
jgi:hypothetical protein